MHRRPLRLLRRPRPGPAGLSLALALSALGCERAKPPKPPTTQGTPAPQTPVATPPTLVHSVEGIHEYALSNGMRVLLFPDASRDRITVNITYLVGSRHEGYGETGMAHLLEHLLFKGTEAHPNPSSELQDHGAQFNGTTWLDRTNYFETMPAREENLDWALGFEADRMLNNAIAPAVLAREFSVVRNEFEMDENDAGTVLNERILSSAYLWHNYGKSTIGARSDIERVNADSLRAFYRTYYQPDNAVLVIAGRFDQARALELVQRHFGALARPTRPLPSTYTVEPIQDGERAVTLRRAGDIGLVGLVYHSVAGADADYVASEALLHLMIDDPSGRLYRELVASGAAASVDGFTTPLHDPGWLELDAQLPDAADVDERALHALRGRMTAIVEDVARAGVTAAEVDRYKHFVLKRFELAMTDTTEVAIELSEWAALGDWRMMFLYRDRVEALTPADVQRYAAAYLRPDNRTVGLFVPTVSPQRAPMPPQPDLSAMLEGYTGRGGVQEGEVFAATLENIEARTTRRRVEPGIELALLPKRTRGGAVTVRLRLRYGAPDGLKGKAAAATMLPYLLLRGTQKRDYQQLRDALDRLRASVWFDGEPGALTVSITTIRASLPEVLALVVEALREPGFSRRELEILKKEWIASLQEDRGDPSAQATLRLRRLLAPYPKGHVRYTPTTDESIAAVRALSVRDIKDVYTRFLGASAAQLSAVGDFDPATLESSVRAGLGDWRSPRPFARAPWQYQPGAGGPLQTIDTPDKEMAMVAVGHALELQDDMPEYPALVLANFILGGSADSRLVERLRQREGWSYGAHAGLDASSRERAGQFVALAICAPQNAEKAANALVEEIQRLIDKGVGADELKAAKEGYLAEFTTRLSNDEAVAEDLVDDLFLGRTTAFTAARNAAIEALTPADIQRALKQHIHPDRLTRILAGDLQRAQANRANNATATSAD